MDHDTPAYLAEQLKIAELRLQLAIDDVAYYRARLVELEARALRLRGVSWSNLKYLAELHDVRPWGSTCPCTAGAPRLQRLDHDGGRHVCCLACGKQWVEFAPDQPKT